MLQTLQKPKSDKNNLPVAFMKQNQISEHRLECQVYHESIEHIKACLRKFHKLKLESVMREQAGTIVNVKHYKN